MYTEKEKIFYIEKMWSEGLRPKAAADAWGLPSRNALSKWEKQALAGELDAKMPKIPNRVEGRNPHARYPKETIDEAMRLYDLGKRPHEIAAMLNLSDRRIVCAWNRKRKAAAAAKIAPARKRGEGKKMTDEDARELERLRLENIALKELVLDPKAGDPASLSRRQLAGLCDKLRAASGQSLTSILALLRLPKSTYEYYRAKGEEGPDAFQEELDEAVAKVFRERGGTYGYRRITRHILDEGMLERCPERKVRESMARQGLVAKAARSAKKWSSYQGEIGDAPENLLANEHGRHDFSAEAPDMVWVTDITEMKFGRGASAGKLYLSVIIDLFDGKPVAWRTSANPNAELANSTLLMALASRKNRAQTIIHSDRGAHYRWKEWIRICEESCLTRSMSKKACSPDNAACEGFFGQMKVEMYHGVDWTGASFDDLSARIDEFMLDYSSNRLKTFKVHGSKKRAGYETIDSRRIRLGFAA